MPHTTLLYGCRLRIGKFEIGRAGRKSRWLAVTTVEVPATRGAHGDPGHHWSDGPLPVLLVAILGGGNRASALPACDQSLRVGGKDSLKAFKVSVPSVQPCRRSRPLIPTLSSSSTTALSQRGACGAKRRRERRATSRSAGCDVDGGIGGGSTYSASCRKRPVRIRSLRSVRSPHGRLVAFRSRRSPRQALTRSSLSPSRFHGLTR